MDTRALNTMHHTKGKITKSQFMGYEELKSSGSCNMFGMDTDIQRGDNYQKCFDWFITNNIEDDLNINLNTGLVELHLVEREDGTVFDPMTGHTVFEKGELDLDVKNEVQE